MYKKYIALLSKKEKFKFSLLIFCNIATFFLEFFSIISLPIFIGLIIDPDLFIGKFDKYLLGYNFFKDLNEINILTIASVFVVTIFLIKNLFLIILSFIQGSFFKSLKISLADKLFRNYVNLPYVYHLKSNPSELTRNISDELEGVHVYAEFWLNLIRESLAILVVLLLLVAINPFTSITIFLGLGFILFIYIKRIKPFIKQKSYKNQELRKNIIQTVYETFGSIKDLKILNKENDVVDYFGKSKSLYEKNIFYLSFLDRLPKLILEILAISFLVTITLIYINLNDDYKTLLPLLAVIAVSVLRFIPAFNAINLSITYMKMHEPSLNVIYNELVKIGPHFFETKRTGNIIKKNTVIKPENFLSIKNVSFSYPNSKSLTLDKISVNIDEGSKVGITGKTGAGKSTLFHLMLGLLKPNTGDVYYKDFSIYNDLKSWRKHIGYVSQNIYLLDSTIKKNIAFNFLDEKIDEKKLERALNIANLKEKIDEMPNGLETTVGSDGLKLSGGERQRIALARAVYKEPNIFFLDESTSALDDNTEEIIMKNISENFKNKTFVIIAHRKTTIDKCDNIWNLKNGSFN